MVLSAENSQGQFFLMFDNPPCGQVILFAELLQKIAPTAVFQTALFLIHYQNVILSFTTKRLTIEMTWGETANTQAKGNKTR